MIGTLEFIFSGEDVIDLQAYGNFILLCWIECYMLYFPL